MEEMEFIDLKRAEDRIGDRQFSTTKKKVRFAVALIVTVSIWALTAWQFQEYIYTFATTREAMVKKHQRIENVPMWKIVVVEQ